MMAWPVAVEPVNISLSTSGWLDRRAPTSPVARYGGEHVVGQHAVEDLDQRQDAQRRVLRGLDHDRVAHPQGGCDLPDGDHHRPVPRADGADHADRTVVQLGVGVRVVDDGLAGQLGGRSRT